VPLRAPIIPILVDSIIDLLRKHRKEEGKLSILVDGDSEAFEKVLEYAEAVDEMVAAARG
jgi:hypothetical protein